jgi:acetylornithine deacetylase/succinyl-diaminopimelate desuccinylase-like protein
MTLPRNRRTLFVAIPFAAIPFALCVFPLVGGLGLAVWLTMPTVGAAAAAQSPAQPQPDWSKLEDETMRHYQTLLRFDTSDPPGNEEPAAQYLKQVLDAEGIPTQLFSLEPHRVNVVARLKGSGRKRPLLIMGHTDVVNVDPTKWQFPPFGATRNGGYVYGRGTIDDKDNVTASLMAMLVLKRFNVPLDRDVIFLAEAGEEGTGSVGIQFMVNQHFPEIDAEYCFAEGGGATRIGGEAKYVSVQTLEKIPREIELVARGVSGHGSVPLKSNAVVHLSAAVAAIGAWKPEIRLNDTTRTYFTRLASISSPEDAARYRNLLASDAKVVAAADDYFLDHEPRHASMLRTSISPTILHGGYRKNVIPSEAKATLDVRMLPDEDPARFLDAVTRVVNDPAVDVRYVQRETRPGAANARLDSDAFKITEAAATKHYKVTTLPTMGTGATDMAYLRAKGIQCFGVGPATDIEDGPKGYGAHSDQERLLESELHRFVRFYYDAVAGIARANGTPQSRPSPQAHRVRVLSDPPSFRVGKGASLSDPPSSRVRRGASLSDPPSSRVRKGASLSARG